MGTTRRALKAESERDEAFDNPHHGHDKPKRRSTWVRLDDMRRKLRIDRDDLDTAAIEQPQLFFEVAEELALAVSRRDGLGLALEQLEARVSQRMREQLAKKEERVTEAMIRQAVETDERIKEAKQEFSDCKAEVDLLAALRESYQQRMSALKILSDLWKAGYFGAVTGSAERREAGDRKNQDNRRTLAEAREGTGRRL